MNDNRKIPTLIAIGLLMLGVVMGIFLVQRQQIFRIGAQPEAIPENVRVSNINSDSFSLTWTTDKDATSLVKYTKDSSNLSNTTAPESIASKLHFITISGLEPSTIYNIEIVSNGETYDNNGTPWQAKTSTEVLTTSAKPIYGQIQDQEGNHLAGSIVFLTIGGASPISTTTSDNGNWVLPLSSLKTQSLDNPFEINEQNTVLEIAVYTPEDTTNAYAFAKNARPMPTIILGQPNDFRNSTNNNEQLIDSSETTTDNTQEVSTEDTLGIATSAVDLTSLSNGEVIYSDKPEFFGSAPEGKKIIIQNPENDYVVTDENGNWRWSPDSALSNGSNTLVLSWVDENDIMRSISRNFIVNAQEDSPAFESTPSASPTNTSTPKPTPTPTKTPTIVPSPLPEAGVLTPTLVLSIMGIGLTSVALFLGLKLNT